jgi:hypothetical protein
MPCMMLTDFLFQTRGLTWSISDEESNILLGQMAFLMVNEGVSSMSRLLFDVLISLRECPCCDEGWEKLVYSPLLPDVAYLHKSTRDNDVLCCLMHHFLAPTGQRHSC